jgi:hypothetical protein
MSLLSSEPTEGSLLRKTLVTMGAMVGGVVVLLGTLSLVVLLVVGTGKSSSSSSSASSTADTAAAPSGTGGGVKLPGTGPTKIKGAATAKAPPAPGQEI